MSSGTGDPEHPFHENKDPNEIYELVQLLGEGSYGSVYKGVSKEDRTAAAVKIVSYGNKSSVTAEIDFLRRLKCEYVVSYIDGYLFDGELWIVMEFCAGGSLSDLRDITKQNLTEFETRAVIASSMLGLEHLHSLNNIHRDIKAGNILLTADGKAKLADFGVSAQLTNSKNMRKTMIGTPFWMAPELIQETYYNGKADIWSLGITILELIEGHPPHFNVHPMRAIFMIPMKPAPRLAEPDKWSKHMNEFVEHCLVKEVSRRWEAKDLLLHDWIKEDVAVVRSGRGIDILRKLVSDNWDAIEASRFNQNGEEEKETDNDTDSDKTATQGVDIDKESTLQFNEGGGGSGDADGDDSNSKSTSLQVEVVSKKSSIIRDRTGTKGMTSKDNRPQSRRIRRHTTSSQSKSTTGEGRNTSSSQLNENVATFQKLNISSVDEFSSTLPRNALDGTLKAGTKYSDADDGTLKAVVSVKPPTSKNARFDSMVYFQNNNLNSTTNPALVYDLLVLLGEGSYGRVYKGVHKFEQLEVAIKIIPCDTQDDITSEIEFLRKLKCAYIVSFVDGFLFEDELWIIMEYCAGGSLSDLRDITKQNLTENQMQLVISYCVLGLKHLHSLMSIHRDIKAGNILLTVDGRAKLADFGVSAQMQSATAKRRTVIGTPFWMAPEVIQETSYDSKADIWSLGITALELCEGRPPHFEVHPMRAIFLIPIKPAPRLKEPKAWSPEMNDFMARCLVKEPESRFSAAALCEHPWISKMVTSLETGHTFDYLRSLVLENIEAIQKARESRRLSKHLQMKRPSLDEGDESAAGADDGSSVATMELKGASRETSLNSESTIRGLNDIDSDFDDNTFVPLKQQVPPVEKTPSTQAHAASAIRDEKKNTWFTVDSMRNSFTLQSLIGDSPSSNIASDDAASVNSAATAAFMTPDIASTTDRHLAEEAEAKEMNYSSAKKYFQDMNTKQDVIRQLALLEQQYKADKEKLENKYQMNRNKLKLALASFN